MDNKKYEIQSDDQGLIYSFISEGIRNIVKIIRYDKLDIVYLHPSGMKIDSYNLGFGDKKDGSFDIDDKARSNNGDMFIVFNTVLQTIPIFFGNIGDSVIHIVGADRIRHLAYHRFINQRFYILTLEYEFYGLIHGIIYNYQKGTIYDVIVVLPKKL